jgi:hypothetical protein
VLNNLRSILSLALLYNMKVTSAVSVSIVDRSLSTSGKGEDVWVPSGQNGESFRSQFYGVCKAVVGRPFKSVFP